MNHLRESLQDYIDNYDSRVDKFIKEYEAIELDFIETEIEYFENTLWDIQHAEGSTDGFSVTGFSNFKAACDLIDEIGYEKFLYPTKNKIRFLEVKKRNLESFQNNFVKSSQSSKKGDKINQPKTFEDLFYDPLMADKYLQILQELDPPYIDSAHNYIGKSKGIFALWIKVLKSQKPKPLIKHFPDKVYKDLLNEKINGLNLSADASEFRKQYKRLEKNSTDLDIRALLSQISQEGK